MEPMQKVPVFKRIIVVTISALIILSAVTGVFIMAKRQDIAMHNNSIAVTGPDNSDIPTQNIRNPDSEVRGVWIATVTNINFPSKPGLSSDELKAELDDIIATTVEAKLNAIYFQVRPAADALYNSAYFPLSAFLVESQDNAFPQGFDPFAYLIEQAHMLNIQVHAWVNPLRVTFGTAGAPSHDTSKLGVTNPARLHPEWTVPYADGRLYFDAGIPEVRNLVARGVAEIAVKYDVDGIIFDDYFYPYPVKGAEFDDVKTYEQYGKGFADKGDWRRDNVNRMVEECYNAIKAADSECLFGIAPFGIWQNNNGTNGGSDTNGFDSYSQIYCDALAWIKGGYIDYIAPQIYWQFTTTAAKFDVLCRWWNAQCAGTGVDLLIAHGVYRSGEWGSDTEILHQVEYARSEVSYKGSIHYGYAALAANVQNLIGQMQTLYANEKIYSDIMPDGRPVTVTSPPSGSNMNLDSTYLIGSSDPGYPLYLNDIPVSQTKNGYFSAYVPLEQGENKMTFRQNGIETEYILHNNQKAKPEPVWREMDSFEIKKLIPSDNFVLEGGESIAIQAVAPSGSRVSATINGVSVALTQTTNPPENAKYMEAVYAGTYKLPSAGQGEIADLGQIIYHAARDNETAEAAGAAVSVKGVSAVCAVEVIKADSELKVAADSWYYDDYAPAAPGMTDNAVRLADGYYKLRMGGYIKADNVKIIERHIPAAAWITSADVLVEDNRTKLYIKVQENVPVNGFVENGKFVVTLYNVSTDVQNVKLNDNPLFSAASVGKGPQDKSFRIFLSLIDADNFYGFEFSYSEGYIIASFRNPSALAIGEKPLENRTIIIDAGHGGKETGALGPHPEFPEKVINLKIALETAARLEELGARVLLTRSDDSTVPINDRLVFLNEVNPDLSVSIHLNSMNMNADITKIRGLIGLYFADAGKLLTKTVSSSTALMLSRMERNPAVQRLAMVRNPKFPSTLIEAGFMTCVEEYNIMTTDAGIHASAQGIVNGILEFYRSQEKFIK
ncbi:MAG: family 10 glycosylhydrolase [Eubacteriales bacterium]|nr:family 10 glycosylhydrolase [Eubacteriales bacterium]